jgi:lipoprotein signal peptidase
MVGERVLRNRPTAVLAGVFTLVVGTDQLAKWLAWRHLDGVLLNQGGFIALRPGVRALFAAPTAGAVADAAGVLAVAGGVWLMARRPRRPSVLLGTALLAAGWTSNLLDRLGLHELTAPGSARGVVDFIPSGGRSRSNVADLWIVLGLAVLLLGLSRAAARGRTARSRSDRRRRRAACGPAAPRPSTPGTPGRPAPR